MERHIRQSPVDVDVMNWMSRASLELVGQGGLGYSFDPLVEDMRNSFGDALKSVPYVLFYVSQFFISMLILPGAGRQCGPSVG